MMKREDVEAAIKQETRDNGVEVKVESDVRTNGSDKENNSERLGRSCKKTDSYKTEDDIDGLLDKYNGKHSDTEVKSQRNGSSPDKDTITERLGRSCKKTESYKTEDDIEGLLEKYNKHSEEDIQSGIVDPHLKKKVI